MFQRYTAHAREIDTSPIFHKITHRNTLQKYFELMDPRIT